jgi:hypothetical protein
LFCAVNWRSVKSATEWPGHFLSSSTPVGRVSTDTSGSFQNSTARTSPAKCQGGDGTNAAAAQRGPRSSESFQHLLVPTTRRVSAARQFNMKCLRWCCSPLLDKGVMTCWFVRPRRRYKNRATSRICSMLRTPILGSEGLQRGRKLQTLTFRDKRPLRQECIDVCHEASDEHRKPEQMDAASANAFGAVCVSLALLCATASPAPSFSQGTPEQRLACAPGVFRPCRCVRPQCNEMTTCLREKSAELTDACKTATEVGMKQLPRVSDGTELANATAS